MIGGIRNYLTHLRMFSGSVWAYMIGAFLMGVGHAIFRVLRNQYVVDLGMGESAYTSIQGFNSIGGLLIAIPAIALIGRFRARTLLVCIALANGLAFFAQGVFGSIEVFLSSAFFAGTAMSLNMALASPFLMRNTNPAERIFAFSFQAVVAHPLAGVLGSMMSGFVQSGAADWAGETVVFLGRETTGQLFGYQIALLLAAAFMFLALIPIFLIRRENESGNNRSIRELMRIHDKKRLLVLCTPEMVIGLGAGLTIPFFNVYFQTQWELDPKTIGLLFTAMAALQVISFLLAPALVKRWGPVKVIIGSQLLSLPFFVELALGHFLWLAVVAFILRNNLMNLAQPVLKQFSQEVVTAKDRNAVSVIMHSSRHVFWTVGNFIAAPLIVFAEGTFKWVFVATIACYVVAIGLELVVFPRMYRTRERETPDEPPDTTDPPKLAEQRVSA
ncbi:MAG: MFS transporter [Planctomycetes bacterium]|nr:MFS transporter [Planctomycetota bacterium]MCA8935130.1 MFS transporter [Planctomycetota bacterium]MCA8946815.1 MFS transporter [Planctomycetota bacterium]